MKSKNKFWIINNKIIFNLTVTLMKINNRKVEYYLIKKFNKNQKNHQIVQIMSSKYGNQAINIKINNRKK